MILTQPVTRYKLRVADTIWAKSTVYVGDCGEGTVCSAGQCEEDVRRHPAHLEERREEGGEEGGARGEEERGKGKHRDVHSGQQPLARSELRCVCALCAVVLPSLSVCVCVLLLLLLLSAAAAAAACVCVCVCVCVFCVLLCCLLCVSVCVLLLLSAAVRCCYRSGAAGRRRRQTCCLAWTSTHGTAVGSRCCCSTTAQPSTAGCHSTHQGRSRCARWAGLSKLRSALHCSSVSESALPGALVSGASASEATSLIFVILSSFDSGVCV